MSYNYELVLILSAKLAEEKQKKILDEVKKYITSSSAKIDVKLFGKKKFAYPIKKESEGFYYIFTFALSGKEIAQLSNKLKLNEGILRYLILRK